MMAPRALAPSTEGVILDEDPLQSINKGPIITDLPPTPSVALQRNASGEIAKARIAQPGASRTTPTLLPQRTEDALQPLRPQPMIQQRALHGPRSGFFTEERTESRQPAHSSQYQSPDMQPFRPSEKLRPEQTQRNVPVQQQQQQQQQQRNPSLQQTSTLPQQFHSNVASSPPGLPPQDAAAPSLSVQLLQGSRQLSPAATGIQAQFQTKQEPDAGLFRRHIPEPPNPAQVYVPSPAHSPTSARPPSIFNSHAEPPRPSSTPAAPQEPPRPTPGKISNIRSILNDDLTEQPVAKRPSLEHPHPSSIRSTPKYPQPPSITQQPYQLGRSDELASLQPSSASQFSQKVTSIPGRRASVTQLAAGQPIPEYGTFSSNQVTWMDRFDPRQNGSPAEQMTRSQAPSISQYSSHHQPSQPHQVSLSQQNMSQSHHRSILNTALQHPGHAPSPPPALQATLPHQAPLYRTSSQSSNHSRMPSFASSIHSTPGAGPATNPTHQHQNPPHSTVQSPVPTTLHRPTQSQLGFEPRKPLQQPPPSYLQQQPPISQQPASLFQQELEPQIHRPPYKLDHSTVGMQTVQHDMTHPHQQQQQRASMIGPALTGQEPRRTFTPPGIPQFLGQ